MTGSSMAAVRAGLRKTNRADDFGLHAGWEMGMGIAPCVLSLLRSGVSHGFQLSGITMSNSSFSSPGPAGRLG